MEGLPCRADRRTDIPVTIATAEPPLEPPASGMDREGSGQPERRVVARRPERELVQVGLATSTAPASRAARYRCIARRHVPSEHAEAAVSARLPVDEVLERVGMPCRDRGTGRRQSRHRAPGLGDRAGAEHGDERIERPVVRLDLREACAGEILR